MEARDDSATSKFNSLHVKASVVAFCPTMLMHTTYSESLFTACSKQLCLFLRRSIWCKKKRSAAAVLVATEVAFCAAVIILIYPQCSKSLGWIVSSFAQSWTFQPLNPLFRVPVSHNAFRGSSRALDHSCLRVPCTSHVCRFCCFPLLSVDLWSHKASGKDFFKSNSNPRTEASWLRFAWSRARLAPLQCLHYEFNLQVCCLFSVLCYQPELTELTDLLLLLCSLSSGGYENRQFGLRVVIRKRSEYH